MKLLDLNIGIKEDNINRVVSFVNKLNPDICALQEVMLPLEKSVYKKYSSAKIIEKQTEHIDNHFAGIYQSKGIFVNGKSVCSFNGTASQGMLITSKYKITDKQNLFYYNSYQYTYDATNFKTKDWARSLQVDILDVNGKHLQIINVHGIWTKDKLGDDRTIEQSKFILNNINFSIPSIVVGDFNLLPCAKSIKLLNNRLTNLCSKYNVKTTRPQFDDGVNGLVCDYIFVNDKVKVNDFKVLKNKVSDHYPLLLDFEI